MEPNKNLNSVNSVKKINLKQIVLLLFTVSVVCGIISLKQYNRNATHDNCFYCLTVTAITGLLCCCCMLGKFLKNNIDGKEVLAFINDIEGNLDNKKITLEQAKKISKKMHEWANSFRE